MVRMHPQFTPADIERFWSKVDTSGDCWLFMGACTAAGYGEVTVAGRLWYAHRFAYTITYGPIPDGLFVCHRCDTPPCVRPAHLFAGTHSDNMRDMLAKGRQAGPETRARGDRNGRRLHPERYTTIVIPPPKPGEANPGAKLTTEQVMEIRRAYASGEANQRQLGDRYGVSQVKISQIILRKSWAHIP
jgi:hypothetical protein